MADDLLKRLEEAERLGLAICGEARRAISQRDAAIAAASERHAESRADALAAAYAVLTKSVGDMLRDVRCALSDDGSLEDLRDAENACAKILESRPPEKIGHEIVEAAREAPGLREALLELDVRALESAGFAAEHLRSIGVFGAHLSGSDVGIGAAGTGATLEIRAYGPRAHAALRELFATLVEQAKAA